MKIDRIISLAALGASVITIVLVLKKPQPVATPQPPAAAAANAQSFQEKVQQLQQPREAGEPPAEVHVTADEISAAIAQAAGTLPAAVAGQAAGDTSLSSPDAVVAPGQPSIKDYQVNFDGDIARGQFVADIGGKSVVITLAGHLGSKDGYATFDPTEFKVGDLSIPVSLVNDALQKKLAENHEQLKLPDNVGGIRIENGELVMTQK